MPYQREKMDSDLTNLLIKCMSFKMKKLSESFYHNRKINEIYCILWQDVTSPEKQVFGLRNWASLISVERSAK
jgi:hypothetical protein